MLRVLLFTALCLLLTGCYDRLTTVNADPPSTPTRVPLSSVNLPITGKKDGPTDTDSRSYAKGVAAGLHAASRLSRADLAGCTASANPDDWHVRVECTSGSYRIYIPTGELEQVH